MPEVQGAACEEGEHLYITHTVDKRLNLVPTPSTRCIICGEEQAPSAPASQQLRACYWCGPSTWF